MDLHPDGSRLLAGGGQRAAGDVNDDGYDDVLVGAGAWTGSFFQEGKVWLFVGGPSGLAAAPAWEVEGGQEGAWAGLAAGVGDVNADGYGDFVYAVSWWDGAAGADCGKAALYLGASDLGTLTPEWTIEGTQAGGRYGHLLPIRGDVDGDGTSDFAIGAPFFDTFESADAGAVHLYLGDSLTVTTVAPGWPVFGEAGEQFGYSGAGGDHDGDGYADLIAAGPAHPPDYAGRVQVFLADGAGSLDAAAAWEVAGGYSDDLGYLTIAPGDVNGDGYADLGFFGYSWDASGYAEVHLGGTGGPDGDFDWRSEGASSNDVWGLTLAGAGDVDGDGLGDLLVGSESADDPYPDAGVVELRTSLRAAPQFEPTLTFLGGQTDARAARLPSTAGDLDGDGYDDLVLGAPGWDDATVGADTGRLLVHYGSATGLPASPDLVVVGSEAGAEFGSWTALGDVDGDGYADLAVGSTLADGATSDEGVVELFGGSAAGLVTTPSWSYASGQQDARLGSVSMGDHDGDGFADLLAGAYLWDGATAADEGAAMLFLSDGATLGAAPAWTLEGGQLEASFGAWVDLDGDLNGDGFDDAAVTAYRYDGTGTDNGLALVVAGAAALPPSPTPVFTTTGANGALMGAVAHAGDVDGDGYGDLAVGSQNYQSNGGRVDLFYGSAAGPVLAGAGQLLSNLGNLGANVAGADFTGDGVSDLLATAHSAGPTSTADSVQFHEGGAGGFTPWSVWAWTQTGESAALWGAHATTGDFDGDGLADVVIGAPYLGGAGGDDQGGIHVFGSRRGDGTVPVPGPRLRLSDPVSAAPVAPGGRSDGLGVVVTMFVRGPQGAARAKLQVEVAEPAGAFPGTPFESAAYTGTGPGGGDLSLALEGLASDTAYALRARIAWDPAQAPPVRYSRWMHAGRRNDATGIDFRTAIDGDGDGDPGTTDCDDADPTVYTGAPEACDTLDADCDGSLVDDDADLDGDGLPDCVDDDADGDFYCVDPDGDGCDPDPGGGPPNDPGDCDDGDATIFPGAPESCDDVDSDCDGSLADEDADLDGDGLPDCTDDDTDGDGFCDDADGDGACDDGAATPGDCDDGDASVFPGADESCDGTDSDCDGSLVDEDADLDDDGLPDCADPDADGDGSCDEALGGDCDDCDDTDPAFHPGAVELCDDLDHNCNGNLVDGAADLDGDLLPDCIDDDDDGDGACDEALGGDCADCDDQLGSVHPDATEDCAAVDSDCDGSLVDEFDDLDADGLPNCVDDDADGDGYEIAADGDCDDGDATVHPGATELCDGLDNDCDGAPAADEADLDGDGWTICGGDCIDQNEDVNPGLNEVPNNGLDDDCEGGDATADGAPAPGCACAQSGAPPPAVLVVLLAAFLIRRRFC